MTQTISTRRNPSADATGFSLLGHFDAFIHRVRTSRPDASRTTTLVSAAVVLSSQLFDGVLHEMLLTVGMFALSGAVTNWIAIHMLFEKVPGLYGSGVIQTRFAGIRAEIRRLVLEEFFNREHVGDVLKGLEATETGDDDALGDAVLAAVDLEPAWLGMKEVVMNSTLGGALAMLGGEAALAPLREPMLDKTRELIAQIVASDELRAAVAGTIAGDATADRVLERVTAIIDTRVEQMTPALIKAIVQRMISEYLGWLVVWGGVFGGMMGLIAWAIG